MSAADLRTTSGVFIRPVWRRAPGRGELAVALLLAMVPLVGLLCLTVKFGDLACHEGSAATAADATSLANGKSSGRAQLSPARTALAALSTRFPTSSSVAKKAGAPGGTAEAVSKPLSSSPVFDRYLAGRTFMNSDLSASVETLKVEAASVPAHVWIWVALLILLGPLFCFLAWPLRRAATALLGAYVFGSVAYEVARLCGMHWTGSLVVSLAPAFLGALVGWHLLVAYTTVLSGCVLGITVGLALVVRFGAPSWLPAPVILLLCCSLSIALVYLLALRPALISGWATLGSGLMAAALVVGLGMFVQRLPLWDLFMACFALLVIAGTITQYRLAGTGEGEGEGDGELAAEAASTTEGQAMLGRLRLEHETAE